ncbi:hypothetical protein HRG84_00410 [Flavisolibacter sp. BT320]|nr:hypothetical protein [Flavisolibacter longurius]
MKNLVPKAALLLMLWSTGCKKDVASENLSTPSLSTSPSGFVQYVIPKGAHYANGNDLKTVETDALKFTVRFDSSAVYKTTDPHNQWDINKLYGFSDNGAGHHQFSARIGWRWSEGALRLFAYTYNNAVREEKEIAAVPIGKELRCAIAVSKGAYLFSVEDKSVSLQRLSTTPLATGYRLYPYFGGDETAPHEVRIWIREEKQGS